RHLWVGWAAVALFGSVGVVLEILHAVKLPFYLGASSETRRLLLRLGHAHGTLLGLVNIALAATLHRMPARSPGAQAVASYALLAATVLLPAGFFLGGAFAADADPGAGVLLVPVGALLLVMALVLLARQAVTAATEHRWRKR